MDQIEHQAQQARERLQSVHDRPADRVDFVFLSQDMRPLGPPAHWDDSLALLMMYAYKYLRMGATAANPDFALDDVDRDTGTIRLYTLQDILDVGDDAHFEQLLADLPAMMRVWRAHARMEGFLGVRWPVRWRPDGGPSTNTAHYQCGATVTREICGD